jgi:hypothetical protein
VSLAALARNYVRLYPNDAIAVGVRRALPTSTPATQPDAPRVLTQCLEDPFYLGLFGHICCALRRRAGAAIALYVNNSVNAAIGNDWRSALVRSFPLHRVATDQWIRLYRGLADEVGFRSASLAHPASDFIDLRRSHATWRALEDASALERLHIDGMHVGDLVIDTYLRFRPSPRIDIADRFLWSLLWQAHREVRLARGYLKAHRPRLYLTAYSTYLQHGITVRAALEADVGVLAFGNLQQFAKRLTAEDSFHTRDPRGDKERFAALADQSERVAEAEQGLELRLGGGIDPATAYMSSSAYAGGAAEVPEVRGAVVVFLHDFYDSPHVYADIFFPEFWSWATFTIETLREAGLPFWVKAHPNQIAASGEVLTALRARYPEVRLLPPGVTNRQLVDGGIACAVTMYGTVAHEMAYLGVPSIACARHPHVSFDFCRTARTREEYAALLRTAPSLSFDRAAARVEALQFYVMHNLALSDDERALRDAKVAAWQACHRPERTAAQIITRFDALVRLPAFARWIDGLVDGFGLRH